jgi:hypothetical protein
MAIVSISVNTDTRESALTVDGQIVPALACHFSKGIDYEGKPFTRLRYILEAKDEKGLTQLTEFFLPDEDDEGVVASNNDGLISHPIDAKSLNTFDVRKAQDDTIRFLSK